MAASVLGVAFFALCCVLSSSVVLSPAQFKKALQTAKKRAFLFDFVLFGTATHLQTLVFLLLFSSVLLFWVLGGTLYCLGVFFALLRLILRFSLFGCCFLLLSASTRGGMIGNILNFSPRH